MNNTLFKTLNFFDERTGYDNESRNVDRNRFSGQQSKRVKHLNIKVFGLGGGGGNTVEALQDIGSLDDYENVSLLHINTDLDACLRNKVKYLLIGNPQDDKYGHGAGGCHKKALACAQASSKDIESHLEGVDVLFLAACLGGGTGGGTVRFVADMAKQKGILTICAVTLPFGVPGDFAVEESMQIVNDLYKIADSVIVIPNQRAIDTFPITAEMDDVYKNIDMVLARAVEGTVEVLLGVNKINIDFNDVTTALTGSGPALIGRGEASGEDKIVQALEQSINNPLTVHKQAPVKAILINITYGDSFTVSEYVTVSSVLAKYRDQNTKTFIGQGKNPELGDKTSVTVVLSGLSI